MRYQRRKLSYNLIAVSTVLTGLLTLASTLSELVRLHRIRIVIIDAHLTIIAGISLIYLAALLRRGKYNAWVISLCIYTYLLLRNIRHFVFDFRDPDRYLLTVALNLLLPLVTLGLLIAFRQEFNVRSSIRNFQIATRRAVILLTVTFLFGVVGFQLFDEHDFRQEISIPTSMHYVIDQFGLTTNNQPVAYTYRARLFVDSFGAMSLSMAFYVVISFFAPVRFRLRNNEQDYLKTLEISKKYSTSSEDFFKFWPRDKNYFLSSTRRSFLAYNTNHGSALAVGDPVGPEDELEDLIQDFDSYCRLNDWSAAFIHTESRYLKMYKRNGFDTQKIGEEALVNVNHFLENVAPNKYFRHINNKFTKLGYTTDVLLPPHNQQTRNALRTISSDWLRGPGRSERGFMMGYFTAEYLQKCRLLVVRDPNRKIIAFLNQVQSPKDKEANYDFLRAIGSAPGNTNDFLMLNFIKLLGDEGFEVLNMGLCPLKGLGPENSEGKRAISGLLNFVYSNAGRFYSFEGLTRFKSKYEPIWEGRYIVHRGGLPGFTKTGNALLRLMSKL